MLKQSPLIDELALVDTSGACGFGIELGHVDTKCKVSAYSSLDSLPESLDRAQVVVLLAAANGSSARSHEDMFKMNSHLVRDFAKEFSKHCPSAIFAIVTDPINAMVPIVSEVMKANGTYNPNKIFGVTTLHVIRTNTFVGNILGLEPECVSVPVLGGGSDRTIVPILSLAKPCSEFSTAELQLLTSNVQTAHREIINIKRTEASTLAAAFATSRFVISIIKGLLGKNIIEYAYVKSIVHPHSKYLATPLQLGPGGIQRNLGIPDITEYETCLLETAILDIQKDIAMAEKFLDIKDPDKCVVCTDNIKSPPCPRDHCKARTLYD
ncbi:malate and lactate dehydrogenase [Holotrichia oblita]|uniref:Malate and lactate dehydrogenase n=2 Tax=Holotrichia oblita TaxID=644536 RepID=A0ACB9T308_HOLOL|nr:malate and lactate dehydrogenase [Holotrichia oblita]KAI4461146.1 malate and lactate dehydrogenase [Holotrichia oblita]